VNSEATSPTNAAARNMLILLSDEHHYRFMGCAGDTTIHTPHLDALAARGTRFANAYTPSPICVPARASLATGLPVHQHRCWDNALAWTGEPKGWGHALKEAGHRVESIGKLHFRDAESDTGLSDQHLPLHVQAGMGQVWGSVRDPLPATRGRSPLYDDLGVGESSYNRFDQQVTQKASEWLHQIAKQPPNKPWVLFIGLVAPHFPLVVPQRWLDLYPTSEITLPELHPRNGYERHPWVQRMSNFMDHDASFDDARHALNKPDAPNGDERRKLAIACYRALTSFMDDCVGQVLCALNEAGLTTNTQVLYSSDHGDNLGIRGLWNKCTMYRDTTGVPMILAGPDVPTGKVCQTPVSLLDVAATVLSTTGQAPSLHRSSSLINIAQSQDQPERLVLSEYHAVGSESAAYRLCNADWALHHYVGFPPELFNLQVDPSEANNLAPDPTCATQLAEMQQALNHLIDPEATDLEAKADQRALVERLGGRECALALGPKGASPVPTV
jgi:choline-sulfatase